MTQLPEELPLRQIRVLVDQPGFSTKRFYIITTLLDPCNIKAEISEGSQWQGQACEQNCNFSLFLNIFYNVVVL